MNLFFKKKQSTVGLTEAKGRAVEAHLSSLLAGETNERILKLFLNLLSQLDDGPIDVLQVKKAAVLLEDFEKCWNKPIQTALSCTQETMAFLQTIYDQSLQKIISDGCLTEFFSGVQDLDTRLKFDSIVKEEALHGYNLVFLSLRLSCVQLTLLFFDAQIKPYCSMPPHDLISYIFSEYKDYANKLRFLLSMAEMTLARLMLDRAGVTATNEVDLRMQDTLRRIRWIVSGIICKIASPEQELAYLGPECDFFNLYDHKNLCIAYILFTTTNVEGIRKSLAASFSSNPSMFNFLETVFGEDTALLNPDLKTAIEESESIAFPEMDKMVLNALFKGYLLKGDWEAICDAQLEHVCEEEVVRAIFLDKKSPMDACMLDDMLSLFDRKKFPKNISTVIKNYTDKAICLQKIIYWLFDNTDQQVNFFVRGPIGSCVTQTLLGHFITANLFRLTIFNNTPYIYDHKHDYRKLAPISKKKIEDNLISLISMTSGRYNFIESFHVLYYAAYRYAQPDSDLKRLLDDLNLILDVLREGADAFEDLRDMLLDNEEEEIPLDTLEIIRHRVDQDLWEKDQTAEKERIKAIEDSLYASKETSGSKKKKHKKKPSMGGGLEATACAAEPSNKKRGGIEASACAAQPTNKMDPGLDKPTIETDPALGVLKVTLSDSCLSLATSASTDHLSSAHTPQKRMPEIEALSELNQSLLKELDAFKAEIQRVSATLVSQSYELIVLNQYIEQRQLVIRAMRSYFKKAKNQVPIVLNMEPLTTPTLALPEWLESLVQQYQGHLDPLIALLESIEPDKLSTLAMHRPALLSLVRSISIPMLSIRQLPSFKFLSTFRAILDAIWRDFQPLLVRVLSNEQHHSLGALAFDIRHFAQLILEVRHWSYLIATCPMDRHEFKDLFPLELPVQRGPVERDNPMSELGERFSQLVQAWNYEVNRFAMAASDVIPPKAHSTLVNSSFIHTITDFHDKLSHRYFKKRHYPYIDLLDRLFHPLAQVELYGTQLFMNDPICDVDVRLKWHEPKDSFDSVIAKIKLLLITACDAQGFKSILAGLKIRPHKLFHSDGNMVDVLKIKIPALGPFHLPIDLSIFVGHDFPLVSYVSHAAGILYTRTGRLSCPHDFFNAVLNNQLMIKEPTGTDFSPKSKCSRLTHVLKLIIRATYVAPPHRVLLGETATRILTDLTAYRSNIQGLKVEKPEWAEAFVFLLEQHLDNYELSNSFFSRTALLLAFYHDMGCHIFLRDGNVLLNLMEASVDKQVLSCKAVPAAETSAALDPNAVVVKLPRALSRYLSVMPALVAVPGTFFASSATSGSQGPQIASSAKDPLVMERP